MFESVQADSPATRFRRAALAPLAAVLLTIVYLTVYPLLPRVPAPLFWVVVAVLFLGAVAGGVAIVRALRGGGSAIGWLMAAMAMELVCVRVFLWFGLPWL